MSLAPYEVVGKVDVSACAAELAIAAPQWDAFKVRQEFAGSPHVHTKSILLRGSSSFLDSYKASSKRHRTFLGALLPHTCGLVNKVLAGLPIAEVGNVMAVMLMPGKEVLPHIDEGEYPDKFERFHIVVSSPFGCWYDVEGERNYPEDGDVFFFNHRVTHSVGNPTDKPRIHLIVDATLKE